MIIILFSNSFIKAWSPWFFKALTNEKNKPKIVKYTYLFVLLLFFIALGISTTSKWLIPFMTNSTYSKATSFVSWISMGYFMQALYNMVYQYLVVLNKTKILGIITIFASILNLVLNYFLIKLNGTIGAAQSTFIAFTVIFLVIFYYTNKNYPMPWLFFLKTTNKLNN